jgi:hypothetical protein
VLNGSILAILIFLWFSRDPIDSVAPVQNFSA